MNFDLRGYTACSAPLWAICILFAIAPAQRLVLHFRRRRRKQEGHCTACGYDLRATPDRCPECGARPALARANS